MVKKASTKKTAVKESDESTDVEKTKKKNQVKAMNIEAKKKASRGAGQTVMGFFRGLFDTTEADVDSEENVAKKTEKDLHKTKTRVAKYILEDAAHRIVDAVYKHNFSEKQTSKIVETILKETVDEMKK